MLGIKYDNLCKALAPVEGTDCQAIWARAQTLEPNAHTETLSLPLISAIVGLFALPTSTSLFSLPKHSNDSETLLPLCVREEPNRKHSTAYTQSCCLFCFNKSLWRAWEVTPEHWLLLKRIGVQFLAPTRRLIGICNSSSRWSDGLFWPLQAINACSAWTYIRQNICLQKWKLIYY